MKNFGRWIEKKSLRMEVKSFLQKKNRMRKSLVEVGSLRLKPKADPSPDDIKEDERASVERKGIGEMVVPS